MQRRWYVLAVIVLLIGAFAMPTLAQDDGEESCEVDLTEVSALIAQAEDEVSNEDIESALTTLAEVQDGIAEILSQCADGEVTFDAETFEGGEGYFTMDYPATWQLQTGYSDENQGTIAYFATSPAAMNALVTPGPVLNPGEQAVTFLLQPANQFGVQSGTPDDEALILARDGMRSQIPYETDPDAATEILVGEINGLSQPFGGDGFEGKLLFFRLPGDQIAMFFALAAPDEGDALADIIGQIVSTFSLP